MKEAVSDILIGRLQEAEGLNRMVMVSLVAHVVLLGTFVLIPAEWRTRTVEVESSPMIISLQGAPGPDTGMTQIAGRRVQEAAPEPMKSAFAPPPAAKLPEMTMPEPAPKPKPTPSRRVEKPVERSRARKPTTGPEVKSGASRVETGGAAVPFGGLSQGGGDGTGATLDVKDFCCPDYIRTMVSRIKERWNENQGASGFVVVKFTIRRDGMLTNIEVEKPSGNPLLDLESKRAVINTQRIPDLPAEFTLPTLTVHLTFEYKR